MGEDLGTPTPSAAPQATPMPEDKTKDSKSKGFIDSLIDMIVERLHGNSAQTNPAAPAKPDFYGQKVDPYDVENTSIGAPTATPSPMGPPESLAGPMPAPTATPSPMAGMNPQRSLAMAKASMPQAGQENENDKFLKRGTRKV